MDRMLEQDAIEQLRGEQSARMYCKVLECTGCKLQCCSNWQKYFWECINSALHQNDHLNIFFRVAQISKYNNGSSLEINFDCINYDSKTSKN